MSASLNWDTVMAAIVAYLGAASLDNWQRNFTLPFVHLMTAWVDEINAQFDTPVSAADLLAQNWFNEYTIQFAQPINATTEEAIRRMIEQAYNEGWSVPTMQGRLELMFQQWMQGDVSADVFEWLEARMPDFRREMIARTETMRAANEVSFRLYGEWGVEQHEWISTRDDRVRRPPKSAFDHAAADGERVLVGQPFVRTGEPLLYPGDPNGSAGNTINCRCTTAPVV